jgi:hypothetical protein
MKTNSIAQSQARTMDPAELSAYRGLIARLPVTLRPSLNGQLAEWETLFPYERRRVRKFLSGVASFPTSSLDDLMLPLRNVEARMGVERWDFSQSSDTMENASLLARSEFYGQWREQVRRVYAAVESAAGAANAQPSTTSRLVVAILPASLPFQPETIWKQWGDRGIPIRVDGDPSRIAELLLKDLRSPSISSTDEGGSELWLIDAESSLQTVAPASLATSSLSWTALRPLRDHVLERVNTVPRNIEVTDHTLATIRAEDMGSLWPHELSSEPQLQRFLIDLYLSGNGALIFSNAFVQWAANEALRRARPRILIARFGLRPHPKPFTGIAIFENQQRISAMPDVDDPQGSAIDASTLARYILLSVERFPEGSDTAVLVVSESARSAYLSLPASRKKQWNGGSQATPEQLSQWLGQFIEAPAKA